MPATGSPGLKVTTPAFQAGNAGFESRGDHYGSLVKRLRYQPLKLEMQGSSPAGAIVVIG